MEQRVLYASNKTESQVDMKEAKRMTLFNIMINETKRNKGHYEKWPN